MDKSDLLLVSMDSASIAGEPIAYPALRARKYLPTLCQSRREQRHGSCLNEIKKEEKEREKGDRHV